MKKILSTFLLLTAAVTLLAVAAYGQEASPETPAVVAPAAGLDFATIIAAIGAIVILARIVVKLTPTPKDDTVLATIIEWLKHAGLVIKVAVALLVLSLFAIGCGTPHPTTVQVGSDNGNVSGGVTTEITTNITAGVTGAYDPTNGHWTAGIVLTFKSAPPAAVIALANAAGAVPLRAASGAPRAWLLAQPDLTSPAQTDFIAAAVARGAVIQRLILSAQ